MLGQQLTLVQVMACCLFGTKPLPEPMWACLIRDPSKQINAGSTVDTGPGNGLLPVWHQAITWTNVGLSYSGPLKTHRCWVNSWHFIWTPKNSHFVICVLMSVTMGQHNGSWMIEEILICFDPEQLGILKIHRFYMPNYGSFWTASICRSWYSTRQP